MSEIGKNHYLKGNKESDLDSRERNFEQGLPKFAQDIDAFLAWYQNMGHRYEEGVIDVTPRNDNIDEHEISDDVDQKKMLKRFEMAHEAVTSAFPDQKVTLEEFILQVRDSSLALKFDAMRGRLFTPPDIDMEQLPDYSPSGAVGLMSLFADKESEFMNFFGAISWWNTQDDHEYIVDKNGILYRRVFSEHVGTKGRVDQIYPRQS